MYEARRHFLGVEGQESRVAAEERHNVKLIGDGIVVAVLDHFHVVRRKAGLARSLLARNPASLASFGDELAERLNSFGSRPGSL